MKNQNPQIHQVSLNKNKIITSLYYSSHSVILPLFYEYSKKMVRETRRKNTDALKRTDLLRDSRKIGYSPSTEYSLFLCMLHISFRTGQEGLLNCCKTPVITAVALPLLRALTTSLSCHGTTECVLHNSLYSVPKTSYPRGRLASKWRQRLISDMQFHLCLFVAMFIPLCSIKAD